ncbi:MAG: DegV family protein [Firmicutes bacterium]|nr:DegV family protein [Bacillota bacterium]
MIHIITDSAADFEPQELQELNINCIPLTVIFGEQEFKENLDLSKPQFYQLLTGSAVFPTTSQAPPRHLLQHFEAAAASGDDAIYICLSSGLSSTYQTAMLVRDSLGSDHCFVVDSRNATGGQRMLVEQACRLRDAGHTAAEIVAALEQLRERIELYACINTLEYLHRGGRINYSTYRLGTMAQIKPIITVNGQGQVDVPAKTMGMKKGMELLCSKAANRPADPDYPFYVMYTDNRSVAEELARRLSAHGQQVNGVIGVGAAIGSHIGPDACGLVYVSAK